MTNQNATPGGSEDRAVALHYELTAILWEEVGLHEPFASQIAEAVMRGLRRRRGGDSLYVPKSGSRAARDAAVLQAFDGRNRDAVCRRFGISRSTFYEILARRRPVASVEPGHVPA